MNILVFLLIKLLDFYLILLLLSVIASWLVAFDVLNARNKAVRKGLSWLALAIEPPLAYLRRIVPPFGGIDVTPIILWIGVLLLQRLLLELL